MNINISLPIMDSDGNDMGDSETERMEWLAELIPTPPSMAALAAHRSGVAGSQPTQTSQTTSLLPSMQERLALLESDDSPPKVDTVPDDTYFPATQLISDDDPEIPATTGTSHNDHECPWDGPDCDAGEYSLHGYSGYSDDYLGYSAEQQCSHISPIPQDVHIPAEPVLQPPLHQPKHSTALHTAPAEHTSVQQQAQHQQHQPEQHHQHDGNTSSAAADVQPHPPLVDSSALASTAGPGQPGPGAVQWTAQQLDGTEPCPSAVQLTAQQIAGTGQPSPGSNRKGCHKRLYDQTSMACSVPHSMDCLANDRIQLRNMVPKIPSNDPLHPDVAPGIVWRTPPHGTKASIIVQMACGTIDGLRRRAHNLMVFKIGITQDLNRRWADPHIGYKHDNFHEMHVLFASNGIACSMLEVYLINNYKSTQGCWNDSPGGEGIKDGGVDVTHCWTYVAVKFLELPPHLRH